MEQLKNKILLGDCLDVMRSMPDKCVEKDPDYHAASVERLRKHRQQLLLPGMVQQVAVQPELFG